MLQPRESRLLWRRRKRRHNMESLSSSSSSSTIIHSLIIIGYLTLLPQGLTQHNDDLYIVKPTPALRLGKEELTTVLLVNNENHGRYINVRPEVGLLTSTARTFIQEGVTTEYATQVVGTTLDNGRVYAQYLKKSSRVLYNSGVAQPSVVTSWVGESLQSDALYLPQSHNDLFNADQPDWRAIDDSLLSDRRHKDDFIGNTDYVALRNEHSLASSSKIDDELKTVLGTSTSSAYTTNSKITYNFVPQLGTLEENARKVAANKVLPIGDLPTYTIKQNYEPSAYLSSNDNDSDFGNDDDSGDPFGRNPKLIYKKLMQSNTKVENVSESKDSLAPKPFIPVSRHFATVTYYGFADFTTVVGDSVIVFSPSTSTPNANYNAHVTSIKGEATLGAGLPQGPSVSKVPITIAQDIIEPTITQQPIIETTLEMIPTIMKVDDAHEDTTSISPATTIETETEETSNVALETQDVVVVQETQSEILSSKSTSIEASVMLSRPSDEEILRIYNALANANAEADKSKIESTTIETSITTSMATVEDSTSDGVQVETSNVQSFGGATTIFFEDDPFANFVDPSKTSTIQESATIITENKSNTIADSNTATVSSESEDSEEETSNTDTTTKSAEVTTEHIDIIDTTTEHVLTSSEINLDSGNSNIITTPNPETQQSSQDTKKSQDLLPNVLIKEIDPNNDEVPSDCISTSQVFLTQLAKTVTHFETVVSTEGSELKTEIKQQIQPTFEIKEATKYYCIQASKILANQVENSMVLSTVSSFEKSNLDVTTSKIDQQVETTEATTITDEDDKTEGVVLSSTEENSIEIKTEQTNLDEKNEEDNNEHSIHSSSDDTDDEEQTEDEDEEASGQPDEDDEDEEEIELIYKTLYTTYTYLTTFFHDDATSISSHTEVVTNVMTSTLGITSTKETAATDLVANLNDNEINPTAVMESSIQTETTKRFEVPSEVESLIRTDEEKRDENEDDLVSLENSIALNKSTEALATFYTTYTYYTTIFAEGETEIMSHTEVITNIKKSATSVAMSSETIMPTISSYQNEIEYSSTTSGVGTVAKEGSTLPHIPDLGDLSAITLVTDVRSSSSSGDKQIINNSNFEGKISNDQQQQSIYEDQLSSESNTDLDEIIPSATLLLQTSFTTFTYYTTMYSGDKTNVISRLETMTNTVTETLQPSKTINLEGNSVPITYFTTFTYWTKLAKEGQITTLSREETISNVILPTPVHQETQTQIENLESKIENATEMPLPAVTEAPSTDEHTLQISKEENQNALVKPPVTEEKSNIIESKQYTTNVLQPTTYYTTYTYYTTSYETDKTITDSRFETVTNIVTPTVTLTNSVENTGVSEILESSIAATPTAHTETNNEQSTSELLLYDFKKIIDADGISTIFFTTEIKPTVNSNGVLTEVISSTSSLLINEEKRSIQATSAAESLASASVSGTDGQLQKQYKTGLVRLIEGTRIANRTTTLYQSKVIGTVIDQRYAQIIESTSSFIFEKTKSPLDSTSLNSDITPTASSEILNIQATQQVSLSNSGLANVEGSILEQETVSTSKPDVEVEEENYAKTDEKLRLPFQTKKPQFVTPLKPFSNRSRPQFAPKKNSSATIITRSDFTPTITATPALKTINRFSSTRRGSSGGSSSSNLPSFGTSSRRFGRPSKSSVAASSTLGSAGFSGVSRNRFASSSNARGTFASSSRRSGGSTAIRPSFSRPSLFSSGFPGNSRLRVRPTATADFGDVSSSVDITTSIPQNSQEDGAGESLDESEDEEENTTESNRRQNNPLLRLRRPLNRPQGFTPARPQPNSPNNSVSLRRNPLISRPRNGNTNTLTTTTTTTAKPKPRTFQPPLITQNRIRPTNSLFPPRNIFGVQKPKVTTEENRDLSEEDTNENNDDSEYEDDDEEESEGDDEEENNRRRRSNNKRTKREADSSQQNRSNFRNRFRRPKLASPQQTESKSYEDDVNETKETSTTGVPSTATSTQRTRTRFGARYPGHTASSSATTTATTSGSTTTNHKAIRPTRPSGGRAQFTLREKDSSVASTTQKGLTSNKRPAFRRPQPGGSVASRRLSSSTAPSSSTSNKRRLKSFTSNDSTTTSRNSVTGRSRSSSTTSGRTRPSGTSRDSNIGGRNRARNNHNYNNSNDPIIIDNSGTITVTHVIPAEVTIPVVNGKVTEYKQVVTAKTSTEVLGPQQYTTTIANNGLPQLALTREDSSVNYNGATEVTQYILHETPTTTITFTPTTIRGRKTSFSHVLPSTVYSVEQVVSTVQPQISANAPLANILLSQLLLGNVGLPAGNPLLGALGGALTQPGVGLATAVGPPQIATPVTEYKTHASTYVTTVYEGQSTVLPVTFQGKKILTTIFDTTAQTITATEFITDTIVTTPTVMAQPQPVVNSLLLQQLLLQQHLQQQQQLQQPTPDPSYPLNAILNSVPPQFLLGGDNLQELEVSNNIRGSGQGDLLNDDEDFAVGSSVDLDDIALQAQAQTHKNGRKKTRKSNKSHKRKQNNNGEHQPAESSVITLYVSGRRPGEFSTVLSTVQVRPDSTQYKRHAHTIDSLTDFLNDGSEVVNEYLALPPEIILLDGKDDKNENEVLYEHESVNSATQSLESIVGDVSRWYATHTTAATTRTVNKVPQSSTETLNQISSLNNVLESPDTNSTSQELRKQFQHFDSGQEEQKTDTIIHRDSADLKSSYDYRYNEDINDNNEKSQNDDIDEARYNLATRVMSNGVEVIIASDKTKTSDHMVPDMSNSQLQYNKPMTLAASTIKNQMMILLFPSSQTSTDNTVNQSIQQQNLDLPFHTNYFITKTCLTTYTYRTTYVQDGRTTVESREKVISNIATEERNYPKITPSQTIGITLTRTPEFAVGIFPTTYSYFNTYKDVSNKLQVMTSEHTVINTITGPNDYVAYLQPTAKATPALKTNTYYNEVTMTLSQKIQKSKIQMQTVKRNLTQVVVTKSYTSPAHSTSVLTSYYTYDDEEDSNNVDSENLNTNLPTTSLTFKGDDGKNEDHSNGEYSIDKTKVLDDIHIYSTKTFLTTFTYYTTTVLSSYLSAEKSQTKQSVKPLSTVFNYYTRVIENVITDSVPATLLPNELLSKMKVELRRQNHQRRGVIVTTATLKDGQTIKISAMEMFKGNFPTILPTSSSVLSSSALDSLVAQEEEEEGAAGNFHSQDNVDQLEESALTSENLSPTAENIKLSEEQEDFNEDNNGFASLPSEQILSFVEAPNNPTILNTNDNITSASNVNQQTPTSAANQLIQRLTALKPMFNAMADLLQNNFKVNRENVKPVKNIESKQAQNKKINSTMDTTHPIYIPVQKSPIKNNNYEFSNYSAITPQSLHIKPPIIVSEEGNFEIDEKEKLAQDKHTNIIPLSTLTAPRQEQPLHNGAIYIRPGEIITANSDVIVGKPNGIEYVQIRNQMNADQNKSEPYTLDNRQFQVTYYHNKIQHPYKKKPSSATLTSVSHRPQHIPLGNGITFGLRPPNEQHFNKNILKPPPPPPPPTIQSPIPLNPQPGLSLLLTAPVKPSRTRNKPPQSSNTQIHLAAESAPPLHLNSHLLASPTPTPRGTQQNIYNINHKLKNNEILEIQQIPQVFSADLKPSSLSNVNLHKQSNSNQKPQTQSPHIKANTETKFSNFEQIPLENYQNFASNFNWQNVREPQTSLRIQAQTDEEATISPDNFSNFGATTNWRGSQTKATNPQTEKHIKQGNALNWNLQSGRKPQKITNNHFSSPSKQENRTVPQNSALDINVQQYNPTEHDTKFSILKQQTKSENAISSSSALTWNLQTNQNPQIRKNPFSASSAMEKHENSIAVQNVAPNEYLNTNLQNSQSNQAFKEIFFKNVASQPTNIGSFPYSPPTSRPTLNYEKNTPKQKPNESHTKNHQNVSLDHHIFSHTVDVNVPPLTFNREDIDYPQETATAVRGQIPLVTVKELKTQMKPAAYKYMPLITIPANEQQVQVSLTPLNTMGPLKSSLDVQNNPAWNIKAPGNENNIVRKISLLHDNGKLLPNDQVATDQKTFETNNVINIKPKHEANSNWMHHRRQQHSNKNNSNQKPSTLASSSPDYLGKRQHEEKKSTLKPIRTRQQVKVTENTHVLSRTTIQPLIQNQIELKYQSQSLPNEQTSTSNSQSVYNKFNDSDWIVTQKTHTNAKEHFLTRVQQTPANGEAFTKINTSKEQNRATRVSLQKTHHYGSKSNKTSSTLIGTRDPQRNTNKPTAEDINEIMNLNKNQDENLHALDFVTQGEPFRKPLNYGGKNVEISNQTETSAIFVAPGEAFRIPTNKQNSYNKITTIKPKQSTTKESTDIEQNLTAGKEIFVTRETQYHASHHTPTNFAKPLINSTIQHNTDDLKSNSIQLDTKSPSTNTSNATTETVFGLHPPPLKMPTNINTTSQTSMPLNYTLNETSENMPKVTKKRPPMKTNQVLQNSTDETALVPTDATSVIYEQNIENKVDHYKGTEITASKTMNNMNVVKSQTKNFISVANNEKPTYLENESRKSNDSYKLINLLPSELYKEKHISSTTTTPLATSVLTFTTTTTTTIKRIILPTKYITNKQVYTVTTTQSAPIPPPPPLPTSIFIQPTTSFVSTTETTTEVTTLFLTHTKINTIVDTVTSVKTLEPITITTTTTLKPSATVNPYSSDLNLDSFSTIKPHAHEINQDLTYLPYPSVEVVSTNITQESSSLNPNENSIFIIMTNNKNKNKNPTLTQSPHNHQSKPQIKNTIPLQLSDDIDIGQLGETNEMMIEYDNGISFDDNIPIRDEETLQIVNGKSVSSSGNVASVKESNSDDHVILGGVLIATPPKSPTKQNNLNETMGCHPKCKASRNEQCILVDNHWTCLCRPGFARMFPDRPCKPTYTYSLLMHAERVGNYPLQYVNELTDNSTEHYKQLSQLVNNALDRMIMQSDFRDAYHGVEVTQFGDDHKSHHGILIDILLQLSDNSNEKRLEEVFKKHLRLSNYSIGGTDLYTNKDGVDALAIKDFNECLSNKLHDCSENAHCFNLPGTYTCSCVEGYADLSDNPIYPGRICSSEQIGCEMCHYHGKCFYSGTTLVANSIDGNYCECFPWYAGSKCQVNLKMLLIVLLGIGTLLFILLLFCILITCTKRRNNLHHTALAPSTVTSSSDGLQKNSRIAANMVVGLRSSVAGDSLKNNKRQKSIKIDKRSMIKDSSSETSQNSLPYVLKNRETISSCNNNKKKTCLFNHSKKYRHCNTQGSTMEQYSVTEPSNVQTEHQSDLNTVITSSSSFKGNSKQTEQQKLLGNATEYEGHYCEQSDRSLTVMIPRAKYHSSVLSQTQLMHHQLTMERIYKTAKSENKLTNSAKDSEVQRNYKKNILTTRETVDNDKRPENISNPGALISAGFEVSAIVRDNTTIVNSTEQQNNDLVRFDSIPPNYTAITTSDPATSIDSNSGQKHLLNDDRQQFTSNKNFSTNESDYNVYKCEKDLIETMDEWLGNVKLNELSAEARSFDETTIRASTKPLRVSIDGNQTQQLLDEVNTMAERDLGSTFLLPHTHLYKPERQESELSGFDSF